MMKTENTHFWLSATVYAVILIAAFIILRPSTFCSGHEIAGKFLASDIKISGC